MVTRTPLAEMDASSPMASDVGVEAPTPAWTTLDEESASQGFKTGHMRWVLAIGFALAGIGLGLTAILH